VNGLRQSRQFLKHFMIKRIFLTAISLCLFGLANAQNLRTITIVVPFSVGSAQDVFVRLISESVGQELQTRVVVVNKPGAGGTIASAFVASAKPDGLTYLMASSGHHLAGALYPTLTYHPLDSFRGAAFLGFSEFVLITADSMHTPDLASFVARVKSNPNVFNFASAGNGSVTHVGMASFLKTANLQMAHIPLKGTGEIINEVLSGRIQAAMVSSLSIYGYRADPRIKLLATSGSRRSEFFADVPTISEGGYPQFKWLVWAGLLAPAGTPNDKVDDMNRAVAKVVNDSVMKTRFTQMGISPKSLSRSQFDNLLKDDWLQASPLIEQFKILQD
jgi:tripartite-type tricarboxylate transporter receptor subunit TctC